MLGQCPLRLAFVGRPGEGKATAAGAFPGIRPIRFTDLPRRFAEAVAEVAPVDIEDMAEMLYSWGNSRGLWEGEIEDRVVDNPDRDFIILAERDDEAALLENLGFVLVRVERPLGPIARLIRWFEEPSLKVQCHYTIRNDSTRESLQARAFSVAQALRS